MPWKLVQVTPALAAVTVPGLLAAGAAEGAGAGAG